MKPTGPKPQPSDIHPYRRELVWRRGSARFGHSDHYSRTVGACSPGRPVARCRSKICVQHRFARSPIPGYAHLNSIRKYGNQIVGSFRGCSKVLGIDATSGDVVWRVGRTNLSDDEWASRDIGPAPLIPVNDPEGEFCGQHSATLPAERPSPALRQRSGVPDQSLDPRVGADGRRVQPRGRVRAGPRRRRSGLRPRSFPAWKQSSARLFQRAGRAHGQRRLADQLGPKPARPATLGGDGHAGRSRHGSGEVLHQVHCCEYRRAALPDGDTRPCGTRWRTRPAR